MCHVVSYTQKIIIYENIRYSILQRKNFNFGIKIEKEN